MVGHFGVKVFDRFGEANKDGDRGESRECEKKLGIIVVIAIHCEDLGLENTDEIVAVADTKEFYMIHNAALKIFNSNLKKLKLKILYFYYSSFKNDFFDTI